MVFSQLSLYVRRCCNKLSKNEVTLCFTYTANIEVCLREHSSVCSCNRCQKSWRSFFFLFAFFPRFPHRSSVGSLTRRCYWLAVRMTSKGSLRCCCTRLKLPPHPSSPGHILVYAFLVSLGEIIFSLLAPCFFFVLNSFFLVLSAASYLRPTLTLIAVQRYGLCECVVYVCHYTYMCWCIFCVHY